MTEIKFEVRPGTYFDSAVLMQLQKGLVELPGVLDAGVVMATQANCSLLEDNNLLPSPGFSAGAEDLLIVVEAADEISAANALGKVDELLARRPSVTLGEFHPRSMDTAIKMLPGAKWVLVSVPGRYAAGVADQALGFNRHVFLYSDNVPLDEEVRLKRIARDRGLLLMGPDCGTAIINGIGFGFANHVRRGRIGLVGASGTGLQAVSVRIHALGGGVSQAIGTGGRDLHPEVAGITALQALDLLARDGETDVIVFLSKPPDPMVARNLLSVARSLGKPVVVYFIGYPPPARQDGNIYYAVNLSEASSWAVELMGITQETGRSPGLPSRPEEESGGFLRGLFSGGTLAYESMCGLQSTIFPLYSNVPLNPAQILPDEDRIPGHTIVDLGADEFTMGRLHPMIDNDFRIKRFHEAASDPEVGLILMDVVLGEGAHPDPASEFAPLIATTREKNGPDVLVVLIGTEEDSQNEAEQSKKFIQAGAFVYRDLAQALSYISDRLRQKPVERQPIPSGLFDPPVEAINVGLESFYISLVDQGVKSVHLDWKPPAGGNESLMSLLNKLR